MFVQCRKEWKTLSLYKPCLFAFVFLWICDGIVFLVEGESKMLKSLGTSIPSWIRKLSRIEEWGSLNRKRKKICKRVFFSFIIGVQGCTKGRLVEGMGKRRKNRKEKQKTWAAFFFLSLFFFSFPLFWLINLWFIENMRNEALYVLNKPKQKIIVTMMYERKHRLYFWYSKRVGNYWFIKTTLIQPNIQSSCN